MATVGIPTGGSVVIDGVKYTVKHKTINRATDGELIAAVTSKKVRVVGGFWTVASDTTVEMKSATTGGDLRTTAAMTIKAGGGFLWTRDPDGYVETAAGEALNVAFGTACQISGILKYVEI